MFPDPNDKTKFISCQDGIARREKCPPNSVWNDGMKACSVIITKDNNLYDTKIKNKTKDNTTIYFILKNSTPKNITLIKVYDSADAISLSPNSTFVWRPKFQLKYPTAFIALEGTYRKENLQERLLINGQNMLILSDSPYANKTVFIIHTKGINKI